MSLKEKMFDYMLRVGNNLDPPVMLAPEVHGTPGETEYEYCCTFRSNVGETTPTSTIAVSNGPETLNSVNYLRLAVDSVPAGAIAIRYYKKNGTNFALLGEVTPSALVLDDMGQALSADVLVPVVNTSGRPEWRAMLFHHGKLLQRPELMDLQWLLMSMIKDLGDSLHKNGNVREGCAEQYLDGQAGAWRWKFTAGKIYYDGQYIPIPEGIVTLTGSGREKVGLTIVPYVVPHTEDPYQRNLDEAVDLSYEQSGADRLVYHVTWTVDEPGQIDIKEFLKNVPVLKTTPTERTVLDDELARRTYDVSGDFVVRNFPVKMREHESDPDKLSAELAAGKAYPQGYEVETKGAIRLDVDRARDVRSDNNTTIDAFVFPGGTVLGTLAEPFNVDGLYVSLQIGSGNPHPVALSGTAATASEVATAINSSVNAYPTSDPLVQCTGVSGHLHIQVANGKPLTILAVSSDAYSVLGIQTGTYQPTGQRIYPANQRFLKDISDLNYLTEVVEAVTHDGTTNRDLLANPNVASILGGSLTAADAHDGKFDFIYGVDFGRTGNYADFTLYGGSDPTNGQTVYFKYRHRRNAIKGTRKRVRVVDAQIVKTDIGGKDNIVFTGHTSATEVVTGLPVTGLSGEASNVIKILRVNNSSGQSQTEYPEALLAKNATALGFETSQVDWSAASSQPNTGNPYFITFDVWIPIIQGDYLAADSYPDDYASIESFSSMNLRDCIDFRTGGTMPVPGDSAVFDCTYYLSRADKIVVDKFGKFSVLRGTPALFPVQPPNQTGALSLSVLVLSPYTYGPSDVKIISTENMRTTQVGIQELRTRIERLEYWQALSTAETKASEQAAAIAGKGMFTDPICGQGRGDVGFNKNGIAFSASIDAQQGVIRLPVSEDPKIIEVDLENSTNITKVGKVILADFQEETYINQSKGSGIINVNPDEVFNWTGVLSLDPEQDFYNDVEQCPDVMVNFDGNLDALAILADSINEENARSINWSSWSLTWNVSGHWAEDQLQSDSDVHWSSDGTLNQWGGVNAIRERTGTYSSLVPERQLVDLGTNVVDMTALPYMRTSYPDSSPFEISCTVLGVKPNTELAGTIDGVAVDLEPTGTTTAGTNSYQGKTTVMADASGSATCKFKMPTGIRVGSKLVKLFRYDLPDDTSAMSQFTSQGFRQTVQGTTVGFSTLVERTETITQTEFHYGDPLAETWAVTEGTKYVSSVEIAFASKSQTIPVTVEIRQTSNGYPTRKVMQSCTLKASEIQTSADGSVWTKFPFKEIVGYEAGEYCIVLIANTTEYEVFYAELGATDILSAR